MSGHTPSPWTIEPSWSGRCGSDVSVVNRDHAGDDWDICTVHSTEANARLIASAPDMLKVLQKIHAYGYTSMKDFDMVRDVISQATGEPA